MTVRQAHTAPVRGERHLGQDRLDPIRLSPQSHQVLCQLAVGHRGDADRSDPIDRTSQATNRIISPKQGRI